jgi:very-short-patch-repair endonuclease
MTLPEVRLWMRLKPLNRKGFHFRKQVPLGRCIVDFAELSRRLIIEVDGPHHEGDPRDMRRDAHFHRAGFTVLRFWNHEIDNDPDGVVARILAACSRRQEHE